MNINVLVLLIILISILLYITFVRNRYDNISKHSIESFNNRNRYTCRKRRGECRLCPEMPDMSKYVLKSSIPPCPKCPNLENYVLKTKMPEKDEMSKYVLKSSIPPCNCPPCPPCKCPEPKCPSLHEIKDLIKNEKDDRERRWRHYNKHRHHHRKSDNFCNRSGFNISYGKYGLLSDLNQGRNNNDDDTWNNQMAAPAPDDNFNN